jgi:hypothetical protein
MSHSPPIPQGNQSPYPLQEPPHAHHETKAPRRDAAKASPRASHDGESVVDQLRALPLVAVGAAIGLGAALIGGAAYAFTRDAKPKSRRKGKKRD